MVNIIKNTKTLSSIIICLIIAILFCGCELNDTNNEDLSTSVETTTDSSSLKEQIDYQMKSIDDPKILATVNGHEITQIDMDSFGIDGEKHTIDELVEYYIIYDYGIKNNLQIDPSITSSNNQIEQAMRNDPEMTDEYCRNKYGISLEDVIEISMRRSKQAAMHTAFSNMVTEEVLSGECIEKHPELASAYSEYEQSNNKFKAIEEMKNAYYEMIAEDYDIVIY